MLIQWARLSFLCLPPAWENYRPPPTTTTRCLRLSQVRGPCGSINQEVFLHNTLAFELLCSKDVSAQHQQPF